MTSIAATNNAALLILQRAQAPLPQESGGQAGAIDAISAIIYKVAGGDSPVRTQAASQITSGLLDLKQANDDIVSDAMDFLRSGGFQSSDPSVGDTLKALISEDGDRFAGLVKAEKARRPGITDENAITNALVGLIRGNREKFTGDEFVIGFRHSNGSSNIINIEDINGYSTRGALSARHSKAQDEATATLKELLEVAKDPTKPNSFDGSRLKSTMLAMLAASAELSAWGDKWADAFGFQSASNIKGLRR